MNTPFPLDSSRELFLNALPEGQAQADEQAPELSRFYVPSTHTRALNPNNMLVEGIRGSGKSVWWAALQDENHRNFVADLLPRSELANIHCCAGFGQTPSDNYPSKRILKVLLEKYDAQDIWYTIVAFNTLALNMPNSWAERIDWVKSEPERIERAFIDADKQLQEQGLKKLVLFDALDRAADDWGSLRRLLKGLLQVLLEFRSSRAIRLKAFVRPDMLEDAEVSAFPDGSKVLSSKVMLDWPKTELFNLLWHHLGNEASGGQVFRQVCEQHFGQVLKSLLQANDEAVVRLPPSRLEQGYEGIKQDLIELGIFRLMRDERINMPDVYRIGYGLGRKGGVKPIR
ncbi:MAG TPA: hypothetical protein EYP59_01990 [Thiotrichaceae bacterium]|nr:hypothetical protein [Thiotrichaceae bacterium]